MYYGSFLDGEWEISSPDIPFADTEGEIRESVVSIYIFQDLILYIHFLLKRLLGCLVGSLFTMYINFPRLVSL